MDSRDYFIPIAPRSSLVSLVCTVDPDEIRDSSAKSFFHWKTLKCRFIINSMPSRVIASPISSAKGSFFVITTGAFHKIGELQKLMKELNLTYSSPQPVTPRAYTDCIKYTFEFYLSPLWNKVSEVLMKGYDFLKNSEFNDAITSTIDLVSQERSPEDEIRLQVKPIAAKLPQMKLENLAIPSITIGDFLRDPDGILNVSVFGRQKVTIIPSMRKAIINRVLKKIPERCPFKNYSEIRRHWKNMYGYRLPKIDEGMLYYEVYFPIPNKKVEYFIYPEICVKKEIIHRSSEDPEALSREFLHDLQCVMPTMLSRPLKVFQQSQQSPEMFSGNFKSGSSLKSQNFNTPVQTTSFEQLDGTTRLSFCTGEPLEKKQKTTQMSPTPSIRGDDCKRKLNFDNLKRIQEIHNSKAPQIDKKTENSDFNVKIFKSETVTSQFFGDSSADDRKRVMINIFNPNKRKKENFSL